MKINSPPKKDGPHWAALLIFLCTGRYDYLIATQSISTSAPMGNAATW